METDREIAKLINVLRRIGRAASHAAWTRDLEAARFCVIQYNKLLARVSELEPAVVPLFTSLSEDASAEVTRIAANELAAYFEDETFSDLGAGIGINIRTRGCGGRRAWAGRVRLGSCW
jgi:hypothetical protein